MSEEHNMRINVSETKVMICNRNENLGLYSYVLSE